MRVLTWAIRLAIFLFLLAFAARNTDPSRCAFTSTSRGRCLWWRCCFGFFVGRGAARGSPRRSACLIRQRREIGRLERDVQARDPLRGAPPAAEG
jgi:hypothetical protein